MYYNVFMMGTRHMIALKLSINFAEKSQKIVDLVFNRVNSRETIVKVRLVAAE